MSDFECHPKGTAARIAALEAELTEYRCTLEARREASMRAVAAWRHEGSGRDLVMPDHADLVMWLLDERVRLRALLARYLRETPLGHQPHMIAQAAREALEGHD